MSGSNLCPESGNHTNYNLAQSKLFGSIPGRGSLVCYRHPARKSCRVLWSGCFYLGHDAGCLAGQAGASKQDKGVGLAAISQLLGQAGTFQVSKNVSGPGCLTASPFPGRPLPTWSDHTLKPYCMKIHFLVESLHL